MWNLKYDRNKLIYKMETDSQTQRTNMVTTGKGKQGRDKLGVGDKHIQTAMHKIDKKQEFTIQHREWHLISSNNL